uniref:uncharacterized protein LOC143401854 n=1 Tax=Callospermophilus lateralis TaxID=76772 RepID=UPI0040387500
MVDMSPQLKEGQSRAERPTGLVERSPQSDKGTAAARACEHPITFLYGAAGPRTGSAEDQRETRAHGRSTEICLSPAVARPASLAERPAGLGGGGARELLRLRGGSSRGAAATSQPAPAPPPTCTAAAFCLWLTLKQSLIVPAFLSKLWTVVEETHSKEFITWSQPLPAPPPAAGAASLPLTLKQSSNVPAFLSKLWTLVEETHSKEFITWSQPLPAPPPAAGAASLPLTLKQSSNVPAFLSKLWTLVEETHSKEFITWSQFFSDGFRKVVQIIDSGIVKQERDGPVEFQHPYFKQGQDDLLENIKRKVH